MSSIAQFSITAVAVMALVSGCGSASTTSAGQSGSISAPGVSSAPATSESTSAAATPKDPCTVVTAAEIMSTSSKTVSGSPMHGNQFLCEFPTSDGGTVNVGIASPVSAANFQASAQGKPPVNGIGDMAYQTANGVTALVGSTSVSVELSPVNGGNSLDPALKLARLVISRL